MTRQQNPCRDISLVCGEVACRRGVLQRIRCDREINSRRAAIEDLNEVVAVSRTRVATSAVDLPDNQICRVVVLDSSLAKLFQPVSKPTGST